jgi:hypothetical protein
MIPKCGNRFSEKIMLKQKTRCAPRIFRNEESVLLWCRSARSCLAAFASALAPLQHPVSECDLAACGKLLAVLLEAFADPSASRLDCATKRLDVTHACAAHRALLRKRKRRKCDSNRDDKRA